MSGHHHAVLSAFVVVCGMACCGNADAQTEAKFEVDDRVEVERFGEWKTGVVTEVDTRFERVEVLLDELDLPPQIAANLPESARRQHRTVRASVDEVRRLPDGAGRRAAEKPRKWTSKNGRFSVEATFLGMQDDKVALERTDGKRIVVAIDQLSLADAEYVKRAVDAEENPFGDGNDLGEVAPAVTPSTLRKANWADAKTVRPKSFSEWTFQPTSSGTPSVTGSPPAVTLEKILDSQEFFEGVNLLSIAADGRTAIIGREQGKVGDGQRYVQQIDLQTGESTGLVALPEVTAVLDTDPETGCVLYREDHFRSGLNAELTVAQLHGSELRTRSSWRPYEAADFTPARDIEEAWFLGANRVMSINQHGEALTVWDFATARALINVPVRSSIGLKTALSPDRRLLAIVMEQGIAIIDLVEGTHCATLDCEETRSFGMLAFRADNLRLAAAADGDVRIWDLTNGKNVRTLWHHVVNRFSDVTWAGDFLLVANRYLFDTDRRVILWEYIDSSRRPAIAVYRAGRLWFVSHPDSAEGAILRSSAIPHAGAVEIAESLGSPASLLVLEPGSEVKIEVDIHPSVGSTEDVRAAIEENAEQAGLVVAADSPLVITATCKPQEQQKIKINTGDRFRPQPSDIVERTITPHASSLEMTLSGETIYKRGFIAQPGMTIRLEQGELLDAALKRLTSPNLKLLTEARIPSELGRPGEASENGAYGVSSLTGQPRGGGQRFE